MSLRRKIASVALFLMFVGVAAWGQIRFGRNINDFFGNVVSGNAIGYHEDVPPAEFRVARIKYATRGGAGSHGIIQPWWAVDYPYAEEHFFAALRRVTNIDVAK